MQVCNCVLCGESITRSAYLSHLTLCAARCRAVTPLLSDMFPMFSDGFEDIHERATGIQSILLPLLSQGWSTRQDFEVRPPEARQNGQVPEAPEAGGHGDGVIIMIDHLLAMVSAALQQRGSAGESMSVAPQSFIIMQAPGQPLRVVAAYSDESARSAQQELDMLLSEVMGAVPVGVQDVSRVSTVVPARDYADQEAICAICMEPVGQSDSVGVRIMNRCKHAFCCGCIESWFEANRRCPVCRAYVDEAVSE